MVIPVHVALICDGNRRWAREKNLPTLKGHQKGFEQTIKIAKKARKMGVKIFTLWAFSTENWDRTKEEINYLMNLYEKMIDKYIKEALKEKIRLIHLGRKDRLRSSLLKKICEAEEKTKNFTKHYLCIGLDYGGRDEILRAINKVPENFKLIEKQLDTKDLPQSDVDLIIRTGGEQRLSGFMLWQGAYAEYIFVKKYLPDFTENDFEKCIEEYSKRQRRFGK